MNPAFTGALLLMTGVMLGAFGAHGLKPLLSPELLAVYHTAVDYQIWHGLGLLALAALKPQLGAGHYLRWATWAFTLGVLLFSGSLYLLTITQVKQLGMITPLGGISLILGWTWVAMAAWQARHTTHW
ncbi:MAG: DUF423 domain-containing protein [Methylococcales bacterium]|nr:DUF423 domain-containing protein [Methylococcales bacterium]